MRKDLKIGMLAGTALAVIAAIAISLWPRHNLSKRLGFETPKINNNQINNDRADSLQPENQSTLPKRPPQNSLEIRKQYQIINTPSREVKISELYSTPRSEAAKKSTKKSEKKTDANNTTKLNQKHITHTVAAGETLSSISQKYYDSANKWQKIIEANSETLKGSEIIKPGMKLKIPQN
jgi:LysM repeat protein